MWPPFLRCMIFEMLVNGTKPTAVCENIVSVAAYLVPWLKVVTPTQRTVRRWRYELRVLAKALSAYRVAKAVKVAMLGTDGTEYFQTSLLTWRNARARRRETSSKLDVRPERMRSAVDVSAAVRAR